MQQLREKAGLLEPPLLHAVAKSQHVWLEDLYLPFLEFLRCSSRLVLEMSLMVTPYVNYHK